jgi:hypothetical protein
MRFEKWRIPPFIILSGPRQSLGMDEDAQLIRKFLSKACPLGIDFEMPWTA